MDRAYRQGVAGDDVQRLFPPNRAAVALETRRSAATGDGGGPTGRERRLS